MVNMAEEVNEPSVNLPKAIMIAIIASAAIYFLVALVAVIAVSPQTLAQSAAPLTAIVERSAWFPAPLLSIISLVAIINGVIAQLLMA